MEAIWYPVRDARVRAFVSGEGPKLLLIHGTGGSAKTWFNQLRRFATTHTVIALDLPGYGASELPLSVESNDDFAGFVHEWMEVAGWEQAVVAGTSMGGRVALQLALDFPSRVAGLILVDASGLDLPEVPTLSPKELSAEAFMQALFYRPSPLIVRAGAERAAEWYGTMQRLTERPLRTDMQARLGEIRVPTLIVWGANDRIIPPEYAEAFHRGIAGSRLVVIERCGHVPMLERPDEVNQAIADFLAHERTP